jgi:hypothetical protein
MKHVFHSAWLGSGLETWLIGVAGTQSATLHEIRISLRVALDCGSKPASGVLRERQWPGFVK